MRLSSLSLFLFLLLFATGCASFGSHHSIDEATVERHLREQIRQFEQHSIAGMPLRIELERAKVTLGPDNRDVAVLDFAGKATMDALLGQIPVGINFRVEGAPVYDSEEKAVFLRDLKLLDSSVNSSLGSFNLQPYAGMITDYAAMFLDRNPVYRLDEDDFAQRMFGQMNLGIRVAPGRLMLVPGGRRE